MAWISVNDRKPSNTTHVWISEGYDMEAEKGYYCDDYYGRDRGAWFNEKAVIKKNVMFWQPIPAPVKPEPPKRQ